MTRYLDLMVDRDSSLPVTVPQLEELRAAIDSIISKRREIDIR